MNPMTPLRNAAFIRISPSSWESNKLPRADCVPHQKVAPRQSTEKPIAYLKCPTAAICFHPLEHVAFNWPHILLH